MNEMTVTEISARLGITRRRTLDILAEGKIPARQLANGTWLADTTAVARFEQTVRMGSGRTLSPAACWAILWELSALQVDWLTPSTHARVRRRIRESNAQDISKLVAHRTEARQFQAANPARGSAGLIQTGRSAAHTLAHLGVDLLEDSQRVCGYPRQGTADEHAKKSFMLAVPDGIDVIFENNLPIDYDSEAMPSAVIAVDLTRSAVTREKAAGLQALDTLRNQWLSTH